MSEINKTKQMARKQERAILCLLECSTVTEAAKKSGVGESSLRRWLSSDEAFQMALSDAQRRLTEATFARLSAIASDAVETLSRNLISGSAAVEVRAALGLLSLLHKRNESTRYEKMEAQIEQLSDLLDERERAQTEGRK